MSLVVRGQTNTLMITEGKGGCDSPGHLLLQVLHHLMALVIVLCLCLHQLIKVLQVCCLGRPGHQNTHVSHFKTNTLCISVHKAFLKPTLIYMIFYHKLPNLLTRVCQVTIRVTCSLTWDKISTAYHENNTVLCPANTPETASKDVKCNYNIRKDKNV